MRGCYAYFRNKIEVPFSYQKYDLEYFESLAKDFYKYDANGDGFLNKEEFVKWQTDRGTDEKFQRDYSMLLTQIMIKFFHLKNFEISH